MGNYLSRDALLTAGVKTVDVDAFGGTVMVCELPASLVQEWLASGAMGGDGQADMSKLDFVEIARRCIVDPDDASKPLLGLSDVEALARRSFGDIQKVALRAIEISDLGGAEDEVEEEEKN